METYFVISNSDGDTTVESMSKTELLARFEDNYYGNDVKILNKIPENNDTNYWGGNLLIIKGKIVQPKGVEQIIKYDIE